MLAPFELLTKQRLSLINREVRELQQLGIYRPTAAVLLQHVPSGQVLIIFSRNTAPYGFENPGIVKGGIRRGEGVLRAAKREVDEELGIDKAQLYLAAYAGSHSVFSRGDQCEFLLKQYIILHGFYVGPRKLKIRRCEIADYEWTTVEEALSYLEILRLTRPEKYIVLERLFCRLAEQQLERDREPARVFVPERNLERLPP